MNNKRVIKKMITILMIMIMMLMNLSSAAPLIAKAATNSKKLASTYLNATSKYLHLGDKKTGQFNFDIKKAAQEKGASYTWYVKADKGNPDSVSINKKTGVATAKEVGVAYIRCKITLSDGTVLRPQAKVTVRNNITGVSISNLPDELKLTAGKEKDFNRKILSTEGGKGKKSDAITRWEIADDTAGVVSADDKGVVFPTKEGEFKIRALSFQSKAKYNLWLDDKELNNKCVTAASEWHTITVEKSDGRATVNTQDQLNRALASHEFTEITLSTKKEEKFLIEKGTYSNKTLIVDAPNSDMENYGTFKQIKVKAIKDNTWIEYADGNIVYLSDTQLSFVIDSGAEVKRIVIDTLDSIINLEIHGKVDQIVVTQPSQVNITGSSSNIPLSVDDTAEGSTITTSISLDLSLNGRTDVILEEGSEDTRIDKSESMVEVNVDNKSSKAIVITTNKQGGETIEAGKSGRSDETTAPTPIPGPFPGGGPYYPPVNVRVTGVSVDKTTMVLTAGGATGTIIATLSPSNATNNGVLWSSSNKAVATVTGGVVTPLTSGTATITVKTVDGSYTKTCVVTVKEAVTPNVPISAIVVEARGVSGPAISVPGGTLELDAKISPDNATTNKVNWSVKTVSGAAISVEFISNTDTTAVLKANKNNGIVTVIATAADGSGIVGTLDVTITGQDEDSNTVPVVSVTFDNYSLLLIEGETGTITATVNPDDATDKKVTWISSNETVAKVIDVQTVTGGAITATISALKEGTATITARAGEKEASTDVTVEKIPVVSVSDISIVSPSLILFECDVAHATIMWNGAVMGQTVLGSNSINVPLMESGVSNRLEVTLLDYIPFVNDSVVWDDPVNYKVSNLSPWIKDRTEPFSWDIADDWISYSTKTEPANNWYGWHGRKTTTDNAISSNWKVETEFELTEELLSRDGVRTSMWLNVLDERGSEVDWSILQFKIDQETHTKGWQYWNSESTGTWIDIAKDLPTVAGVYKLAIHYNDGSLIGYINGIQVFTYMVSSSKLSSVKEVILNSYSFGESYEVRWKIPKVSYVDQYPLKTQFIYNAEQLGNAIKNQTDGETWILAEGVYDLDGTQLAKYSAWKESPPSPQGNWYLPLYRDNLTVVGIGEVVITSSHVTVNGAWATQNFITLFGNDITLKNLTIKPKLDTNKAIEVIGRNATLENIKMECNDIVAHDDYLTAKGIVSGSDKDYWEFYRNEFAGSIIFNTDDFGIANLKNVLITKAWLSPNYSETGTINIDGLVIDFRGSGYAPYADYGVISGHKDGINYNVSGNGMLVMVDSTIADLQSQVIDRAKAGTIIQLEAGTYYMKAEPVIPVGVTLDKETNGAIIEIIPEGSVLVKNVAELTEALNGDATTIRMAAGTYRLDSQIRINKALNIIGDGETTIITKGDAFWTNTTGSKGYASIITINSGANRVKLQDIKVTGAEHIEMTDRIKDYGHGINVVSSYNVSLTDVTLTDNAGAGLIVNSSNVLANNFKTSGNGWYGVNVDQADSTTATFELLSGDLSEDIQIITDKTVGATIDATGYKSYPLEGTTKTIWSNKGIKNAIMIVKDGVIKYYPSIQAAIDGAESGDIVTLAAGEYMVTDTINVNKAIILHGAPGLNSKIVTNGENPVFHLSAAAVIDSIFIEKTDKVAQHLIKITANGTTVRNSKFIGRYVQGDSDVTRAIVPNAGTNYNISGNEFDSLRQPAYLEGPGLVEDNFVINTRGWVVCINHQTTFNNNSFEGNAVDIALIENKSTSNELYKDIALISKNNNGAYVENQFTKSSAINGVIVVEAGSNQYMNSIQAAINGSSGGNIITVNGEFTLTETLVIDKPVTIISSNLGSATIKSTVRNAIKVSSNNVVMDGLIIVNNLETANWGISVEQNSGDKITIKNNTFKGEMLYGIYFNRGNGGLVDHNVMDKTRGSIGAQTDLPITISNNEGVSGKLIETFPDVGDKNNFTLLDNTIMTP